MAVMLAACLVAAASDKAAGGATPRIHLHVWGMNMGEPRFGWYAQIDAFQKMHPNVEVVIGPTDRGQDLQKLLCGIVGDSPPDVFRRESQLFGDIAARDILMPLDDFIEADKLLPDGLHEDDYVPGVWASGKFNGKIYGIPESLNPVVLAYNKDLFRKAGLDPEKPPRTWDEWREAAKRLTIKDASGRITQLGAVLCNRDDLSFYIAQLGGDVFSADGRKCTLNSAESVEALTFMTSMWDAQGGRRAYDQFAAATNAPEQYNPFGQGKIAMSVEDDWVIYRVMRYSPHLELGIAPVPSPAGRKPITMSATNTLYMIPKNARQPQLAWEFIRFINSAEGQLAYADAVDRHARSRGEVHRYTGFRASSEVRDALDAKYAPKEPFLRPFQECEALLDSMVPVPVSPVSGVLRDEMLRARDRAAYGEMTPKQALDDAARRVQEQLDLFYGSEDLPVFHWKGVWLALVVMTVAAGGFLVWRTRGERAHTSLQRHENRMGLVFIAPWACGLLLFTAGPMVFSIAMSLCDYDVIHPARYVGLRNYVWLFTRDPLIWKSLNNTVFMVLALPVSMAASLGLALLLNIKVRGRAMSSPAAFRGMSVYRTIYYLPAITPAVATAVLWYALLNPDGLINVALNATICKWLGVSAPAWLQDPRWAKPALVLMGLWGAGGGMILWLAGLQGIPEQLYEAAAIDGAGAFRRFRSITLPMLTPYIFFSAVVGIIGVFQIFAQALILTMGGPADSTLFYVYYLFNNAFRYFKMGYASAQAWVLFVIVLALTLIQWRFSKKWVHYE